VQAAVQERLAPLLSSSPALIYTFEMRRTFWPTFVSDNIKRVFGYDTHKYLENANFWWERPTRSTNIAPDLGCPRSGAATSRATARFQGMQQCCAILRSEARGDIGR
jgi:hypothetical protein